MSVIEEALKRLPAPISNTTNRSAVPSNPLAQRQAQAYPRSELGSAVRPCLDL
jgi:hypothetical protein